MNVKYESRERVIRALKFQNPDKVPVDMWLLPFAFLKYGDIDQLTCMGQKDTYLK